MPNARIKRAKPLLQHDGSRLSYQKTGYSLAALRWHSHYVNQFRCSMLDEPTIAGAIPLAVPVACQTDEAAPVKTTKGFTVIAEVPSCLSQDLISVRGVKVGRDCPPYIQATFGGLFRWAIGYPNSIDGILSKDQVSDLFQCCSH